MYDDKMHNALKGQNKIIAHCSNCERECTTLLIPLSRCDSCCKASVSLLFIPLRMLDSLLRGERWNACSSRCDRQATTSKHWPRILTLARKLYASLLSYKVAFDERLIHVTGRILTATQTSTDVGVSGTSFVKTFWTTESRELKWYN